MKPWNGRVFLNPPYKHPIVENFVKAMIKHNHGTALLFNRFDSVMWQELIFPTASLVLVLKGRVKFLTPDGLQGGTPGTGSSLVAWCEEDAEILRTCGLEGTLLKSIQ